MVKMKRKKVTLSMPINAYEALEEQAGGPRKKADYISKLVLGMSKDPHNMPLQIVNPKTNSWDRYAPSYRSKETQIVANWIVAGQSGSVIGLPGAGCLNFLTFLSKHPDVLRRYLPENFPEVILISIDLYNLPSNDRSALCRFILLAFYEERDRFSQDIQQTITKLYMENRALQDPFLPQTALYDVISLFQNQQIRVVLLLSRFDRFCEMASPHMVYVLRALRDQFKNTLTFIVTMMQEAHYLPTPDSLGDMYPLISGRVCWLGSMSREDASRMLDQNLNRSQFKPTQEQKKAILKMGGHFPWFQNAITEWWMNSPHRNVPAEKWPDYLLNDDNTRYRLRGIWNKLTNDEQLALTTLQKFHTQSDLQSKDNSKLSTKQMAAQESQSQQLSTSTQPISGDQQEQFPYQLKKELQVIVKQHGYALNKLVIKGLCIHRQGEWFVNGELLLAYVATVTECVRGAIWTDETTQQIYQGNFLLEGLTALEHTILNFLIHNPRIRHTSDDIIDHTWPDEERREGITTNALQVHISSLRKKIEPNPARPRYLMTWRGNPGGYQFFPEGKPE